MCELFGLDARHPTRVNDSLALLQPRGGLTGPHADGWGLALYEGNGARLFKEPAPAAESRCLSFIASYELTSRIFLAHIRKANPEAFGRTSANTHPFERELGGRSWVFAHNGKLDLESLRRLPLSGRFLPIGDTDSELAFCYILDHLADTRIDSPAATAATLRAVSTELVELGEFNFLLSDGRTLYAYADTNLHALTRRCHEDGCNQAVSLLATRPLTEEAWQALAPRTLHSFGDGRRLEGPEYEPLLTTEYPS